MKTFVWNYLGNPLHGWPRNSIGDSLGSAEGFTFFRNQSPAAFDINQDGYLEILSQDIGDSLYIYDRQGNLIDGWPAPVEETGWLNDIDSVPAILKDESSGEWNIYIPLQINSWVGDHYEYSSKIFGFHSDGSQVFGWPVELPFDGIIDVSSATSDLDGNGHEEMIFLIHGFEEIEETVHYKLFIGALDKVGNFIAGWPKIIEGVNGWYPSMVVANLDGDNSPEIVVTYSNYLSLSQTSTFIEVYNSDGSSVAGWPKEFYETRYISYPTVGDVDGDGLSDILVCVANSQDSSGTPYAGGMGDGQGMENEHNVFSTYKNERPADGKYGVYAGASEAAPYYTGKLYALKRDGSIIEEWPISTGFAIAAPTICDLDNDGKVEVVLADYNGWIHAWEFGDYRRSTMEWPMYRHDPQHTGRYEVPNKPPILDPIGDKTVNEGQLLEFTVNATDDEPLTYSASNLPSGAVFNPTTRIFSWTPTYAQAGIYPGVHFEVSDGELIDWEDITITVNNVVVPPPPSEDIIYEDAEDGNILGWDIYDSNPAGATITNVYDTALASRVISLSGAGRDNGYRLRNADGSNWTNSTHRIIQWKMKYSEPFTVFISCNTTAGHRYISYNDYNRTSGWASSTGEYIYHGLGSSTIDGQWHTIARNLQDDLHELQPDVDIITVDAFLIRGSGRLDDIKLLLD